MQSCGTVVNMWTKETLTTGVRPSNSMIGLAVPLPGSQRAEQREHELENDVHQWMAQANQLNRFAFGCDWRTAASQKKP